MLLFLAFLIGIIAGLRAMTAPAAVAWGAALGAFNVSQTSLAFMGYRWTPWIFTVLAAVEMITDQLPTTPSRKVPMQFGARIIMGALGGASIGASGGFLTAGLIAGILGAVVGTLGGAFIRGKLAKAFGKDLPAAVIEDAVAIGGALLIVVAVP
ncbi:putative membrane protein [Rhizobium azibense]|nr:putative membrane protein [Rhizobium azibense]